MPKKRYTITELRELPSKKLLTLVKKTLIESKDKQYFGNYQNGKAYCAVGAVAHTLKIKPVFLQCLLSEKKLMVKGRQSHTIVSANDDFKMTFKQIAQKLFIA